MKLRNVIDLKEYINTSIEWNNLRHDRERRIAQEYFAQGWQSAKAHYERRELELETASPLTRHLYYSVLSEMKGGQPQ